MAIKYINEISLNNKKVLIRVDYNVPYDRDMNITDDTRIKATLPTLNYCIERSASVILISHLGRPKGKVLPEMSLKPVAMKLSELLGREVKFIDKSIGDEVKQIVSSLREGEVVLLENIRFYPAYRKF